MSEFANIENTERFIAYRDEFGEMSIKPVAVSEMWHVLMGEDWWWTWEEDYALGNFFNPLTAQFKATAEERGVDILDVSVDMRYSLKQPPGVDALIWGHHIGSTEDGYIFRAKPGGQRNAAGKRVLTFVTGFVRAITMEPLG